MTKTEFPPKGNPKTGFERVTVSTKKPLYIVQVLDTSGSMDEESVIVGEGGRTKVVKKIEQLNEGVKKVVDSLRSFERKGVFYDVFYQIIELNSYGKPLFQDFVPISKGMEEVEFKAEGCTCLDNSLETLKRFINEKHMPGYNRPVSVILMSDGVPTDANGFALTENEYKKIIDDFKAYLKTNDYARSVDLYAIAVGRDACREMLEYFSGADRFFTVEESESLAEKLDFVTRATIAKHVKTPLKIDYDEEESEDENDDENENDGEDEDDEEDEEEEEEDEGEDDNEEKDEDKAPYLIKFTNCRKDKCQKCLSVCPNNAIYYKGGMVFIDQDKCISCGKCMKACPYDAIYKGETDGELDDIFG